MFREIFKEADRAKGIWKLEKQLNVNSVLKVVLDDTDHQVLEMLDAEGGRLLPGVTSEKNFVLGEGVPKK